MGINKILAVRNDRFGEFLLNIPVLRALKETFLNARIIVALNPYVRELAECVSFIDEIIEWPQEQKHSLREKLQLIKLLKAKNIDMAIMLNSSKEFNIFSYLAGIPIRVGYDRKWGFLLTHKIEDKKYLGFKHEIDYNLELVGLIGAKTEDKNLSLNIGNNTGIDLQTEDTSNLVALHPWTSDSIKQWPVDNFRELADRLIKELKIKIMIIGGKEESGRSVELFKDFDSHLINMTGKTSLGQLAALLKKCKLLISGDSGPVHLACAVGTPVITLFRSDIPGKSAKRWGPSLKGSIVLQKDKLDQIGVEEVFSKAREVLDI